MMEKIVTLVEEHKFFRRFVLMWSMGLITYCSIEIFDKIGKLSVPDVAAFTAVIGLLATTIAFYQWSRHGGK